MRNLYGLVPVNSSEAVRIVGGVDKGAQEALYYIGYLLGVAAKYLSHYLDRIGDLFKKNAN